MTDIFWKWKRYSTRQFLKLVIFSVHPSSIGIDWESNQEIFFHRSAESKVQISQSQISEKEEKIGYGGIEPRTVTLSHSERSGPLYIPLENAICECHISDRQHYVV